MQFITTVTQKGQITLPIAFRRQLDIIPYSKVILELTANNKAIQIKATKDILDLAGSFVPRANQNKSALQARESMEKNYQRA
ncbi:MAG: AbrB/MazE/SpoVT family DNA-binding domain-containing protein [Patescibacteria group bacterium]|nr:AbrB/MazE/SpoVT family DNA-binding domain-containing protein [Patescibacteria group bacterium]